VEGGAWRAERRYEKPVGRDEWQAEPVVLVSSFLMRRADRQRELLDAADWTCSFWTKRTTHGGAGRGVRRRKGRTHCSG